MEGDAAHKILIVDDNADTILILSGLLEVEGCGVMIAVDGLQAIHRAEREQPALILLDLTLPKRSGLEVCRTLKENPKTKEIPILILTAKSDPLTRQKAETVGADEYLTKPFNPGELIQKIKGYLLLKESRTLEIGSIGTPGVLNQSEE